ncbi:MAG: DMT family transporter [Desulfobacteraceae bacterium]|nr:DMT family transporter [Desulfobacteraceae bacterium]
MFFYAISQMQFAEAVLLSFTYPLFMPILAYWWLNEPVSRYVRAAVIIGFVGMALIVKPGGDLFRPIALIGISSGILVSLSMVGIRRMSATEPPIRIVFYFTLISAIVSALPLMWTPIMLGIREFFLLILIGLFAVIGQIFLTQGYSLAPAAQVGPFGYGNVVFSAIIGWMFWDEALDNLTFIGAMLICTAGILSTWQHKTVPEAVRLNR